VRAAEHDVGVLAQDGAERVLEGVGVRRHLALVHDALLVAVDELDRVLDGHDVRAALGVDLVDHGRQRGGLARAGGAGDQDQPLGPVRERLHDGGKAEVLERPDLVGQHAHGRRHRAPLQVDVAAEAREPLDAEGEVQLVVLLELLLLDVAQQAVDEPLGLLRAHHVDFHDPLERAIDTELRRRAGGDVQIGGPARHHQAEQVGHVDSHRSPSSNPAADEPCEARRSDDDSEQGGYRLRRA
jgi:hypothetical protein